MEEFQAMDNVVTRFFGNTTTQSRKREPRAMYTSMSVHNIVSVIISEPEALEKAACQTMDITFVAENGERVRIVVFGDNIQVSWGDDENPSAA
jgi:hypothetical protein